MANIFQTTAEAENYDCQRISNVQEATTTLAWIQIVNR